MFPSKRREGTLDLVKQMTLNRADGKPSKSNRVAAAFCVHLYVSGSHNVVSHGHCVINTFLAVVSSDSQGGRLHGLSFVCSTHALDESAWLVMCGCRLALGMFRKFRGQFRRDGFA